MDAIPTQCHLWQKENLTVHELAFEKVRSISFTEYPNITGADHEHRYLVACKDCVEIYLYEFLEWINHEGGNDYMCSNHYLIPPEELEEAIKKGTYTLKDAYPHISWNADGEIKWITP